MKKLIALLLALLMLSCAALAEPEAEENAYLTQEELEMYLNILTGDALDAGAQRTEYNAETGVATIEYGLGAKLFIADEELIATSAVLGAVLSPEQEDLRGIHFGESLRDVLAVYPNDNPDLTGTRYDAVLYVNGDKPETTLGYLLRDGQRVTEVTHLVFTWKEDQVVRSGITYTFENDMVTNIAIFGLDGAVEEADALQQIADAAALQEINEFTPYPVAAVSADLTPFQADDLAFGGLRFDALTPDEATEVLGKAAVDEWMEDSTGEYLRTLQWEGVSIVFLYDSQKSFLRVDSLGVNDDVMEGPRGVRIDDSMESVMNRFRHGENAALPNGIALYGDGENAPYAVLSYSETTATLTYCLATGENASVVIWQLTFVDGMLQNYRMLLR